MSNSIQANQWLSRFRLDITSNSNSVYANGRQQVEVTVTLEPRGEEIIDEGSLASLTLITVDDDGNIRELSDGLSVSTERDERFEYHGASGRVRRSTDTPSVGTLRRRFYVSSTLPGGTLSTIHAGIWKDQTTHFETIDGPFKSSVVIESISPPRLGDDAFQLTSEGRIQVSLDDGGKAELETSYFGFRNPNDFIVDTRSYGTASGEAFYEKHVWEHVVISFTGTNDYNKRYHIAVYVPGEPFEEEVFGRSLTLNEKPHHMSLLWQYHRFYNRQYYNDKRESPSIWGVIDQNGNQHIVEFFAKDYGESIGFRTNWARL